MQDAWYLTIFLKVLTNGIIPASGSLNPIAGPRRLLPPAMDCVRRVAAGEAVGVGSDGALRRAVLPGDAHCPPHTACVIEARW